MADFVANLMELSSLGPILVVILKNDVLEVEFEDSSAQITPCGHNSLQSAVQLGLLAAAAAKSSPSGWLTAEMGVCRRRSSACTRQWGQGQAVLPPICRASTISCSICRASNARVGILAEQAQSKDFWQNKHFWFARTWMDMGYFPYKIGAFRCKKPVLPKFCRSAGLAG